MARRGRSIGAGAIALATGMLIALPTFSSGATVKNDLRSFDSVQPRVVHEAVDPKTEPPLHGTNPHGQGTAAVVDLTPDATRPYTVDGAGTSEDEDIVIGRSRGEQRADGTYHGHITVAALFGNEIIEAADTGPGQTDSGSLLEAVTTPLCNATGICLGLVEFSSSTSSTGSSNSFRTASVALGDAVQLPGVPGLPPIAPPGLSIGAASSFGNIGSNGTCQTAVGGSQVADVAAGVAPVVDVAESRSESIACTGGTSSQTNSSRVVELAGDPLPLPLLPAGCANGTRDTETGIPLVLEIVCNADDSSATAGTQAANPAHVYGVRNALDVYVLAVGDTALAQVSAAQSESLAVAPAAVTTPTTTTPTTTTPTTTTTTTTPTTTTTTPGTTTTTPGTAGTPGGADDGGSAGTGGSGDDGDDGAGDDGAGDDGGAGAGTPECSDGVDNDGDGEIDFGNDPDCTSAQDDSEASNAVSLGGKELPFTGTDVVVLGLAGSLLLAAGLTLRGPAARRREFDAS